MTATSLRKSYPWRNALRIVTQNKKMTIVSCILQLLGVPLIVAAAMIVLIAESRADADVFSVIDDGAPFYMGLGFLCLAVSVFLGLFHAVHAFTEVHKKSRVDMLYALPLTGTGRFCSDYAGGFLTYLVPYLVCTLLGWGLLLGMAPLIDFSNVNADFTSFGEFMSIIGKYYAMASVGLFFLMLLYYTMSTLITVCCGTLFESIYTNVLLNFLLPGTAALFIGIVCNECGFEFDHLWQSIGYFSPIGGAIYLFYLIEDSFGTDYTSAYTFSATQTHSHDMLPSYLRWLLVIFLLSAAMFVLAWKLYTRRKAEDVGKPFIYNAVYYVMLTLVTLSILCLMVFEHIVGAALLLSAIVYFVMEVIRKRGFRKFWVSVMTYAATVVVGVGAYHLVIGTGCFGRTQYVPNAGTVSSVVVQIGDTPAGGSASVSYRLEYTDREVIAQITDLHREILRNDETVKTLEDALFAERWQTLLYHGYDSSYDENGELHRFSYPTYTVQIPYTTDRDYERVHDAAEISGLGTELLSPDAALPEGVETNYLGDWKFPDCSLTYYTLAGTQIHRSYALTPDQRLRLFDILYDTPLYAEASANGLHARYSSGLGVGNASFMNNQIPDSLHITLSAPDPNQNHEIATQSAYLSDAPAQIAALCEAYRQDLDAMTAADFREAEVWGTLANGMPVYTQCSATCSLLREWGLEDFNVPERFGLPDKESYGILPNNVTDQMYGIQIYAPGTYRSACDQCRNGNAATVFVHLEDCAYSDVLVIGKNVTSLKETNPALYTLLSHLRPYYAKAEEGSYYVNFDGFDYILPAEYADAAKALIK